MNSKTVKTQKILDLLKKRTTNLKYNNVKLLLQNNVNSNLPLLQTIISSSLAYSRTCPISSFEGTDSSDCFSSTLKL